MIEPNRKGEVWVFAEQEDESGSQGPVVPGDAPQEGTVEGVSLAEPREVVLPGPGQRGDAGVERRKQRGHSLRFLA